MIIGVAIRDKDGKVWSLPGPKRHGHVIHAMVLEVGKPKAHALLAQSVQGFINDSHSFLDRNEAFLEALRCNQVLPPYNPINTRERRWDLPVDPTPRELFSEDLW